jgi:hypothetical protein
MYIQGTQQQRGVCAHMTYNQRFKLRIVKGVL